MTSNELRLTVSAFIAVACLFIGLGAGYVLTSCLQVGDADLFFGVRLILAMVAALCGFVWALDLKLSRARA